MASELTRVAYSANVEEAAFNLNAKANELGNTIAGVWNLKPTDNNAAPESAFAHNPTNDLRESKIGQPDQDGRKKVDESDFMQGGKYRSIVKVFTHYEYQDPGEYAMGTGWLISPDTLITAGHMVYDWGHELGRAIEIKTYIGYKGHGSENDPSVQYRAGKKVVTTVGWLKDTGAKRNDVGFIQVNKPFTEISPFQYKDTPAQGVLTLGVVGYPGDKEDNGEYGAYMYEMFLKTKFDLLKQKDKMLEYILDTSGGNSGGPVLVNPGLYAIGTHVYGGEYNSASVIGRFGNPYDAYISAFKESVSDNSLHLLTVGAKSSAAVIPERPNNTGNRINVPNVRGSGSLPTANPKFGRVDTREESFMDLMKGALSIGVPLIGGPLGALAGFVLNAAGGLAESSRAESGFEMANLQEGTMERAILAEAALSAVQDPNLSEDFQESIFSDMKDFIVQAAPTVRKVAPHVLGAMMEPALRMALEHLQNYNQGAQGTEGYLDASQGPFRIGIAYSSAVNKRADVNTESFINSLQNALSSDQKSYDDESAESFISIITAGARLAGKGLAFAAKNGLPILAQLLTNSGAEALIDTASPSSSGLSKDNLAKRAIAGEAALQAILRVPADQLEEEGIFTTIADIVKKVAPVAMKLAPGIISSLPGVIGSIFGAQESVVATPRPRLQPAPNLTPKRSQGALRKQPSTQDFLAKVNNWNGTRS